MKITNLKNLRKLQNTYKFKEKGISEISELLTYQQLPLFASRLHCCLSVSSACVPEITQIAQDT